MKYGWNCIGILKEQKAEEIKNTFCKTLKLALKVKSERVKFVQFFQN